MIPLVICCITMEKYHFQDVDPPTDGSFSMAMFGYVQLPVSGFIQFHVQTMDSVKPTAWEPGRSSILGKNFLGKNPKIEFK